MRALIVFTKFKDDFVEGDPGVAFREWPLFEDPGQLPAFSHHLLSPSPTPPFPDSSLTAYFYQQSLGRFVLFGEVYDSVLVSEHPEARYHRGQGGYGDLTKELLDRIDGYGFDFSKYDYRGDGLIDHIFIVLRGDSERDSKRFVWTGASCLDARCSGSLAAGGPREALIYDGKTLDWNTSGSYIIHRTPGNIIPLVYHVRLMAHELGHDLWAPYFVHVPSYRFNDVPLSHNRGRGSDCIGYVLMAGSGGAWDCQGSQTISAFERDLLGWIDCRPLTQTMLNVEIGDLYTTSDCYRFNFEDAGRRIYLSNLQRLGYFDRERKGGVNGQFDMGLLRTTGLLLTLGQGYTADILPADNDLQLDTSNAAYEGDLFGPATSTQLTPWTRPNSNGFNKYPKNHRHSWMAIDNIRYSEDAPGVMLFDFYADFRENPIIREDSWMGGGLEGYVFENPVIVSDETTLTIEGSVTFAGGLHIGRRGKVIVSDSGMLHLASSSTLQMDGSSEISVAGTLILDALVQRSINTYIRKSGEGVIRSNLPPTN